MLEQTVQNRRPTPVEGLLIIAATVAAILLGSTLFGWLERWIGHAASLCFLVYGALIAIFLMNRYVMAYHYAASDDVLRLSHSYGRYRRFICDVWLNRVKAAGAPDELRRRFPDARVTRCAKPKCDLAPLALAWTSEGKTEIVVIQPDDALRAHLMARTKKR